jgi:hypothetical protein
MARLIAKLAGIAALAFASGAAAQQADAPAHEPESPAAEPDPTAETLTPPNEELLLPPTATETPGAARLEPQPEERESALEVVIVSGRREEWRLPDLGTELRQRREDEARANQRFAVELLPLHDPENQDPTEAMFDEPDPRRVGWVSLFEVDFGRRNRD